jgi:miniconductance mechanosensitive channel
MGEVVTDFDLRVLQGTPMAALIGLVLAAWLSWFLASRIVVRILARMAQASPTQWDDAILQHRVPQRLAWIVPALVLLGGLDYVEGIPDFARVVVRNVALAWRAIAATLVVGGALDALNTIYERYSDSGRERPIKGYLQLLKIVFWIVAIILVVAALINRSPLVLLTGLGAMTAVLLLVFKDTLLSLVASLQIASNDMLRVGDWIEMPSQGADGDVIDISLHTVKVQNWDKTISTIPTHRLISESFRNWRGMSESGGRRIKRAILLDQTSVRFLDHDERQRLRRIALIDEYLDQQRRELEDYNAQLEAGGKDPVNNRRATNLGTFRAYVTAYLRSHPGVNQDMTLMVRQLDPTPLGLPMQVYCFAADVGWVPYENLAGDIFDHLLAVLPEFGLRIYQQPGSGDVTRALGGLAAAAGKAAGAGA